MDDRAAENFEGEQSKMTDKQPTRCWYCGAVLIDVQEVMKFSNHPWRFPHRFTNDHVIPRALGGPEEPSNKVPCCHSCNLAKDLGSVEDFRAVLSNRFGLGVVVFYGEGGRLEDTLRISQPSIDRWSAGNLNACERITPMPKKPSFELMEGKYIEPDAVAISSAGEYFIRSGVNTYTVVDSSGFIVAETATATRQDRARISRLVRQANAALHKI